MPWITMMVLREDIDEALADPRLRFRGRTKPVSNKPFPHAKPVGGGTGGAA